MGRKIIYIISIAIVLIIIGWFLYSMYRIPTFILDQNEQFYMYNYAQTLQYLSQVYPLGIESFKKMNSKQLAIFYNNLDFYYNCCYAYRNGPLVNEGGGWDALRCCNDKRNTLPYPAQGYFYFWPTWASDSNYTVYSDSKSLDGKFYPLSLIGSQRPDVPWGLRSDGGEIGHLQRSGPAPYWVALYTYLRNIYYPFGPIYDNALKKWTYKNGIDVNNSDNMGFVNKNRNWAFGLKQGEYVEIAHSAWEPGMVQSEGLWLTPFYGGGTGLFYKIGTTVVANNKMGMVFKLISILKTKKSSQLSMPDMSKYDGYAKGPDFTKMSGSEILYYWYGSDDPYEIVWKYCVTNDSDQVNKGLWPAMSKTSTGGTVVLPKNWVFIDNKGILSASGLFNKGSIGVPTQPYGPNFVVQFGDLVDYYVKKHGLENKSLYDIKKLTIDAARLSKDYIMDRVGTIVTFDEPIFWLANVLGVETVHMPVSANGNGTWSPEIMHTVVPNPEWAKMVKGRYYAFIEGDDAKSMFDISAGAPHYTVPALEKWQDMISKVITQRDPTNLNKGSSCSVMGGFTGPVINYSDKFFTQYAGCSATTPASDTNCWKINDDYGSRNRQCATKGQWGINKPDDAQVFPGRTFWGYYNNSTCYPFYENMYCNKGLSNEYSMIRIYNGKDLGK